MNIKHPIYHMVANVICIIVLIGMIAFLALSWNDLPDQIPMHYDFAGNVDKYGSKASALFLPILAVVMYIIITVTERFPKSWNTGVEVNERNMEFIYNELKDMGVTLKLMTTLLFAAISYFVFTSTTLPIWFMPVFMVAIFAPIIKYGIATSKAKRM